jgi:hypothetical protein
MGLHVSARGAKVSLHYMRLTGVERRMRARTRERHFDLCDGRVRASNDEHKNRILITSTLYMFRRTATHARHSDRERLHAVATQQNTTICCCFSQKQNIVLNLSKTRFFG